MRKAVFAALLALAGLAAPAAAQVTANLPVTCPPAGSGGSCVRATAVVNPDGTSISAGGGGSVPTGTAGSPNTAVLTVQGITGGTAQNVQGTGTAGTAATGVVTVQGIAGGTAQNVSVGTALPAGTNTVGGVITRGGASLATGQVSIGTTSTLLVAARATRQAVTITVTAATACSFGNTGVTATTGFPLQPIAGASVTLDTAAAIYGACASATNTGFIENF